MGFRARVSSINNFIKKPNDIPFPISTWEKFKYLISGVIYDFIVAFIFVILISILEPLMTPYENVLNSELHSFWISILLITILPPLLEELIFRFPLKYKRNYVFRFIAYLFKTDFSGFWKKHLRIIVYLFSAIFGFIHLSNYNNVDLVFFMLAPIIVGAQLFAGIIFSFFRLKLGFVWALLGHFSHNFILIMMSFMFFHNVERSLVDDDEVKIEATGIAFKLDNPERLTIDSLQNGNILCLDAQNYSLQKLLDELYHTDTLSIRDNDQLDLKLYSKKEEGYTKDQLLDVLKEHYTFKKVSDSISKNE
ncbi:type II CAAX prenyl endopeptidase Rce1 family protein [Leeuwenhoekiella polynyae]|uniref:CAAX prenyl protease-like protein n=1 Tax=Leeuwenhoekiella polynyae TaxID=1550906 RepID=A0A4Q0P5Z3_9FLAO|nr:CPBP family glutamic-type intramembrane protease [Leeuwenhoekiella polynyae]RXG21805.1 CAAX prenyl protease-like protein [Leeuwenhoekiella polynyae]